MLTVITHTKGERAELLDRCKKSVSVALSLVKSIPSQHLVISCPTMEDWASHRVNDAMKYDLVAFVDDDDYVSPESFNECVDALNYSGLGAAVTNEVRVDLNKVHITEKRFKKTYLNATIHPRVVHHLCVLRGKLIDPFALELNNRFGVGVDWFIRQSVVQRYGCVHVPIDGYYWTRHPGQYTMVGRTIYKESIKTMQQLIQTTWPAQFHGVLPVYPPHSYQ